MDGRKDGPTPVILVRFSGNPPAAPRRRKRVRSTAVRTEGAPSLTLIQGDGIREPAKAQPGARLTPVRTADHVRPEWATPLPGVLVDLPDPEAPASHLEAAIDLLRRAAQATSVAERGDATLVSIEHASRSFAELFDREVARKLLRDIADSL